MTKSTKHVICRSKDVILVNLNYMFQKHVIYPIQFAHYIFLWELHVIGADYIIQGNYYMFCFPSVYEPNFIEMCAAVWEKKSKCV